MSVSVLYFLRAYWECSDTLQNAEKENTQNAWKDEEEEKVQEEVGLYEDEEKAYVDDEDSKLPELPPE